MAGHASQARVDMHCHSTASAVAGLGIQRSMGLPECATAPEEVYGLAKRRGMDFVTITDHDTIAGALEIADRPDTFVSVELTTRFAGEPRAAVHVLCHGITPDDHDWLQANAGDVAACAEYMHAHSIACALAHPFFTVDRPLGAEHRRRLAALFPIWEVRNGARPPELNRPASTYVETLGGIGIGGSDDHAGVGIGLTFTQTPTASTPEEFLRHVREGDARAHGEQGGTTKWAHSAVALGIRALAAAPSPVPPEPDTTLRIVERVAAQGSARSSELTADLGPQHADSLLQGWLDSLDLGMTRERVVGWMQSPDFEHRELKRRARVAHERGLRDAVATAASRLSSGADAQASVREIFAACLPVVPYAAATAFLGREWSTTMGKGDDGPHRVALVADGLGAMHGVTHTVDELRARGVPGYEVDVVGTDPNVDRRLPAVADVEVPLYPGLHLGVPSVLSAFETLALGEYDIVHVCSPGPAGVVAALVARTAGLPLVGSYHTELGAYAELRSPDPRARVLADQVAGLLYGACRVVLSPSPSADDSLAGLGIPAESVARWDRGVDAELFSPERDRAALPGPVNVMYAGRLTTEKGIELLADAFCRARKRDPRLHLVVAGDGPERGLLEAKAGEHTTFLGWLGEAELARAYAGADVLLFPSRTDTFGQVILEAQASGLPVVAVDEGGPRSLIEDGVSGLLRAAEAPALAEAVLRIAGSDRLRDRLGAGGLAATRERTWEASLARLGDGYRRALAWPATASRRAA